MQIFVLKCKEEVSFALPNLFDLSNKLLSNIIVSNGVVNARHTLVSS